MMRFWYSASVAAHAKRMSHNDEVTILFHECFRDGCCDIRKSNPQNSAQSDCRDLGEQAS